MAGAAAAGRDVGGRAAAALEGARRAVAGVVVDRVVAAFGFAFAVGRDAAGFGGGPGSGCASGARLEAFGGPAERVDRVPEARDGVDFAPPVRVERFFGVAIASPFAGVDGGSGRFAKRPSRPVQGMANHALIGVTGCDAPSQAPSLFSGTWPAWRMVTHAL
jgi:hypothetical protein